MPDYFVGSTIVESFVKSSKSETEEIKKKLLFLTFQLESDTVGVEDYAIEFQKLDPATFVALISSFGYADKLTAAQLSKISEVELTQIEPKIVDVNQLILPYSTEFASVRRTYRLVLDISAFDGIDGRANYRDIWINFPLVIVTRFTDPNLEVQKLSLDLTITDCDFMLSELSNLVSELGEDLPIKDQTFLREIIAHCDCGAELGVDDDCDFEGVLLDEFQLPSFETESILFEMASIDRMISYLKERIVFYKTDIVSQSSSSDCYKFVPCLIKAYIGLNRVYRNAVASYQALLVSAKFMSERYVALAADHRRGIEAMKGMIASNIEWVKANLDSEFDLSKVARSNTVERNGDVSTTFTQRYSRYYSAQTKSYDVVD